jgi:co-chaperonin GroES (HSP10)
VLTAAAEHGLSDDVRRQLQDKAAARKKLMSSAKKLKLPKLLEKRRQEFGITDGAFTSQPFHDRVFIYQVHDAEETYGSGIIVKAESVRDYENTSCPRGIVVAAGARALDDLRCNGIDLGHIVTFLRMAPWRINTDMVAGHQEKLIILRSGDIVGSEDLAEQLRRGDVKLAYDPAKFEHWYKAKDGGEWRPQDVDPYIPEDM